MSSIGSQGNRRTNRQSQGGSQSLGNQIIRSGSNVSRSSVSRSWSFDDTSQASNANINVNNYNRELRTIFDSEFLEIHNNYIVNLFYKAPVGDSFIQEQPTAIDFSNLENNFNVYLKKINKYESNIKSRKLITETFKTLVKYSIHCKHIENRDGGKLNMLYYILPSNFPKHEESRFGSIKEFTRYPIIMHLFERHPMDYLRIIDAYNSVQTNHADKIPQEDYLDKTKKKLKEIDAFEHHDSADKFLQGVQGVLLGIIGAEKIKKSSEPSHEGGINYMINFIPDLPKDVHDANLKNYDSTVPNSTVKEEYLKKLKSISKSFFTQRLEDIEPSLQNKQKSKIKRRNCHVFIPKCLRNPYDVNQNNQNINTANKIILPISTLFSEEKDSDLFYYIKDFEKIFKNLKLLVSSNDDKRIPHRYQTQQLRDLCRAYTSQVKDDQGNYDTQYRDLIHRYAYYKATGVQETPNIMSDIMNGISGLKQNIYRFINSEKNKEVIESLKLLLRYPNEKLGSNIKENIKDFIKVYDIFIKEYSKNEKD